MLEQRSGVIVNRAFIFGVVGIPQRAAYASSKHGVLGSAMWSYGLASDAAACITGTSIDVHGGWIAHGGW